MVYAYIRVSTAEQSGSSQRFEISKWAKSGTVPVEKRRLGRLLRKMKRNDLNSKIIAFAFALAAEIERNLISQRTKEALADKKAAGVILGRPKGSSKKRKAILEKMDSISRMLSDGASLTFVAKKYGIHRNTLSNYLKSFSKNNFRSSSDT